MMFRFKALERRRQPDQLDSPMILASPRGWVAVFVVLITTVFVGAWGALGNIPRNLDVTGLLGHPGGIVEIQAPVAGTVRLLLAGDGLAVESGATVARLESADGESVPLSSPVAGRLVSRSVSEGAVVAAGTPLLQVEVVGAPDEPLEVFLFVQASQVPSIRENQPVTLVVPGVSPRAFGRLRGTVVDVGRYPLSAAELARLTGGSDARQSAGGSASVSSAGGVGPRLVTVRLIPDRSTASGYAWTSAGGPPVQLSSRTPIGGEIEIGTLSPFAMLVGG
jgi:hypothetical protein